jgi:tRNA 2-thiouridine synthesizing protein A
MSHTVDARGLSCPQPVLITLEEMKKVNRGEIQILVDTDTSKENVSRAAASQGWQVQDVQEEGEAYRIVVKKE